MEAEQKNKQKLWGWWDIAQQNSGVLPLTEHSRHAAHGNISAGKNKLITRAGQMGFWVWPNRGPCSACGFPAARTASIQSLLPF